MTRDRRPGITVIGQAHDDGHVVTIRGWTLGLCLAACRCHRHPMTGQLVCVSGTDGTLGLATFRTDGWRCGCCDPWQPDELLAIVDFLATLAALPERVP